jgi:hypothetical protein
VRARLPHWNAAGSARVTVSARITRVPTPRDHRRAQGILFSFLCVHTPESSQSTRYFATTTQRKKSASPRRTTSSSLTIRQPMKRPTRPASSVARLVLSRRDPKPQTLNLKPASSVAHLILSRRESRRRGGGGGEEEVYILRCFFSFLFAPHCTCVGVLGRLIYFSQTANSKRDLTT